MYLPWMNFLWSNVLSILPLLFNFILLRSNPTIRSLHSFLLRCFFLYYQGLTSKQLTISLSLGIGCALRTCTLDLVLLSPFKRLEQRTTFIFCSLNKNQIFSVTIFSYSIHILSSVLSQSSTFIDHSLLWVYWHHLRYRNCPQCWNRHDIQIDSWCREPSAFVHYAWNLFDVFVALCSYLFHRYEDSTPVCV